LTLFHEREGEDPTTITFDEEKVGVIEKVLEHRGHIEKRSTLSFYVRWQGSRADSWISWEDNRNNLVIHDYLRRHGMGKIIPARYNPIPTSVEEVEDVVEDIASSKEVDRVVRSRVDKAISKRRRV
jgi:hypothetical protein